MCQDRIARQVNSATICGQSDSTLKNKLRWLEIAVRSDSVQVIPAEFRKSRPESQHSGLKLLPANVLYSQGCFVCESGNCHLSASVGVGNVTRHPDDCTCEFHNRTLARSSRMVGTIA